MTGKSPNDAVTELFKGTSASRLEQFGAVVEMLVDQGFDVSVIKKKKNQGAIMNAISGVLGPGKMGLELKFTAALEDLNGETANTGMQAA